VAVTRTLSRKYCQENEGYSLVSPKRDTLLKFRFNKSAKIVCLGGFMVRLKAFLSVILTLALVSCGGNGTGTETPGGDTPGGGAGQCTYSWAEDITVPSRLVNSPAACDYLLEGNVDIKSLLEIEPGTVIKAAKDATIYVEGGDLIAVGTANARITLEGFSPLQGYWRGISISTEAGDIKLEYIDLKDAGQTCSTQGCRPAAIKGFGGGQVTLKNSSISNSYVNGAILEEWLVEFSNNRFYGNREHGLIIDADRVRLLDEASDYAGKDKANGNPGVELQGGTEMTTADTWKKLNAPYVIESYVEILDELTLEPGVEIVGDGGWIAFTDGGTLKAIGTAAQPIIMRGIRSGQGVWGGLQFSVYNNSVGNRLEYVKLSDGGSGDSIVADGLITNYEAEIYIANSSFTNSSSWGISCNSSGEALVEVGPGNTFSDNAAGDIESFCN
jgi:hypothetical protein